VLSKYWRRKDKNIIKTFSNSRMEIIWNKRENRFDHKNKSGQTQ
jgi:hypothetical protein